MTDIHRLRELGAASRILDVDRRAELYDLITTACNDLERAEEALSAVRKIRSEGEPEDLVELRDIARMSGYLTDFGAQEKLRLLIKLAPYLLEASAERDAWRAKFRGLREAVWEGANVDGGIGARGMRRILDSFPDEPSDPAQGEG